MKNDEQILLEHINGHPKLKALDIVKFLYQSEFATGHMIGENALKRLKDERLKININDSVPLFESVCEKYARFNLNAAGAELISDETLISAMKACMNIDFDSAIGGFKEKTDMVMRLIDGGKIACDKNEFKLIAESLEQTGYAPVSHSEIYRESYKPSYRLVPKWFMDYFDVIAKIQMLYKSGKNTVVCIDGKSASGKSTLADNISKLFDCNVWHMDDFFLQKSQRTPERLAEPGGNVDYERFYSEVFNPIIHGENVVYRKFDCSEMELLEKIEVPFKPFNIVEGAYSMRPEFKAGYALTVFLNIGADTQRARILKRNGAYMLSRFENEWIPLENEYFKHFSIPESADIVLNAG